MAVNVTCPECGSATAVGEELLGRKLRCKACSAVFVAAAAKAKVAAGPGKPAPSNVPVAKGRPSANGSNGVHDAAPVARGKPVAPAKAGGSSKLPLFLGGGGALAAMAGVMVWALFFRSTDNASNSPTPVVAPKINITDTAAAGAAKDDTAKAAKTAGAPATTVSRPAKLMAGFADSPKSLPISMDPALTEKVKKSAVMLRVRASNGAGEGSGWFAEPGIVVTNAHVVMMKEPGSAPPQSIRVILESGTPRERELTGKLLAIDQENDLAVVQVKGKDLPEPMPICPSAELTEGSRVFSVGFPRGSSLAAIVSSGDKEKVLPTCRLRQTVVTGRVQYKNGGVKLVQIEGGTDPGNSGSAIIDTLGNVRMVHVAGLNQNLKFSIPSEYAVYLLQGRLLSVVPGQPYNSGGSIKMPLTAVVADPMRRIKNIKLDVWAGDPGSRIRPQADRRPQPQPGDSPVSTCNLAYNPDEDVRLGEAHRAAGECDLPPRRDGQVYWVQPQYERADGSIRWGEAVVIDFLGIPVDRKGAKLALQHQSGTTRYVTIGSKYGAGFVREGGERGIRGQAIRVDLTEKTRELEAEGAAKVQFAYQKFGFQDEDTNEMLQEQAKDLLKAFQGMIIEALVTKRGLIKDPKANLTNVPLPYRGPVSRFNSQVMQSLEGLAMMLPDKDVAAGESWNDETQYTFQFSRDNTINGVGKVRFTHVGTRRRDGREEAVIVFNGRLVKGDGAATTSSADGSPIDQIDEAAERRKGLYGVITGSALVDLETGVSTLAKSNTTLAADVKVKIPVQNQQGGGQGGQGGQEEREVTVTFGTAMEVELQRSFTAGAPTLSVTALLPEQSMLLNPFVGAPDPNIAAAPTGGASDGTGTAAVATGTTPLQMKKEVLDKVKAAACLIRCTREGGGGDGSGWLAEPGIVVTNAHVIGMVERAARPPLGVDVYFDAGLPTMKKFAAKVLTVDHDNDLAVLQLPTKEGLPEPMPIIPSTDLFDSQRLFVLGFPYGQGLGGMMSDGIDPLTTQLKVRDTTVAGRHENQRTKLLKYIQVEGGLTPGNSGGALVDMNGAVRCVAVAIIPNTQIGFTIPSEFAARLLNGYPLEVKPKYAYKDGSVARMPVEIKFGDPLKRVKKVQLDYWVGRPGSPRRSAKSLPKLRSDDFERKTVDISYDPETAIAKGDFVLPESEPGYAYWVQPRYIDGQGQETWGEAVFFAPDGPPIDRREIKLEAKFKPGAGRLVDVESDAEFRYVYFGENIGESNYLFATLAETIGRWDAVNKGHTVGYQFTDLRFGEPKTQGALINIILTIIQAPDLPVRIRSLLSQALYNRDGTMTNKVVADLSAVQPVTLRPLFQQFNNQVLQCIQAMSVRLPNSVVKYGDKWTQPTNLLISARSRFQPALFTLEMTYQGVRERGGRMEAVLEITGSIAQDPKAKSVDVRELKNQDGSSDAPKDKGKAEPKDKGKDDPKSDDELQRVQLPPSTPVGPNKALYGLIRGYAYVDVESGHVSYCQMFLDVDVEIMHKDKQTGAEVPVQAGGTIEMKMTRRTSNK